MHARQMVAAHPTAARGAEDGALVRCIEACFDCAQSCTACADACLAEERAAKLAQCIRLNLDCADICAATGAIASRRTGANLAVLTRMLESCEAACRCCAEECRDHAQGMAHCGICAEACETCADACDAALGSLMEGGVH